MLEYFNCTVENVMKFTICLVYNVVWKLKNGN